MTQEIRQFTQADGPAIKEHGVAYRKTSVTWAMPIDEPIFIVQTAEGPMTAHAGDYLCYDETSGHVWPIPPSYVEQNYERVEEGAEATASPSSQKASALPASHPLYAAFEALAGAARYLSALDVAEAELELSEPDYRPLTRLCGEAAAGLQRYLEEQVGLATNEHVGLGHDAPVAVLRSSEPI